MNRDVDAVTILEGGVAVAVSLDDAPGLQSSGHGPDNGTPERVVIRQDLLHQRHCLLGQKVPTGLSMHLDLGPSRSVGENHDDRIGHLVDIVFLLAIGITQPGNLFLGQNQVAQAADVVIAQFPQGQVDIHGN